MEPTLATFALIPVFSIFVWNPSLIFEDILSRLWYILSFNLSRTLNPAAIAKGFPDNVPAWYTGPSGATWSIISDLPPYAPAGSPPPIIFPSVVISGITSYNSCAPPFETLNPLITSSKINRLLFSVQIALNSFKKLFSGITKPIFPAIGSIITAAILSLFSLNSLFTESISLNSATKVSLAIFSVTPWLSGVPKVIAPDPAFIKKPSKWPW